MAWILDVHINYVDIWQYYVNPLYTTSATGEEAILKNAHQS